MKSTIFLALLALLAFALVVRSEDTLNRPTLDTVQATSNDNINIAENANSVGPTERTSYVSATITAPHSRARDPPFNVFCNRAKGYWVWEVESYYSNSYDTQNENYCYRFPYGSDGPANGPPVDVFVDVSATRGDVGPIGESDFYGTQNPPLVGVGLLEIDRDCNMDLAFSAAFGAFFESNGDLWNVHSGYNLVYQIDSSTRFDSRFFNINMYTNSGAPFSPENRRTLACLWKDAKTFTCVGTVLGPFYDNCGGAYKYTFTKESQGRINWGAPGSDDFF